MIAPRNPFKSNQYTILNGESAHPNGLFPVPEHVLTRLVKAFKNLGVNGYTYVKIPWKDFKFSQKEDWPVSYRKGLEAYQSFLVSLPSGMPEASEVHEFWWNNSPDLVESVKGLTPYSQKDLQNLFVSATKTYKGFTSFLDSNLYIKHDRFIEGLPLYQYLERPDSSFLNPLIPRLAEHDGVTVMLVKKNLPGGIAGYATSILKNGKVNFSIEWNAKLQRESTLLHEFQHIVQNVADQLLIARTRPQLAFTPILSWSPNRKPESGLPRKTLRTTGSSYQEDDKELYPGALSAGLEGRKLAKAKNIPLVEAVCVTGLDRLLIVENPRFLFAFIYAALQYAKPNEEITSNELQFIGQFVRGDEETIAKLYAYFTTYDTSKKPHLSKRHATANLLKLLNLDLARFRDPERAQRLLSYIQNYYKNVSGLSIGEGFQLERRKQ